MDRHLPSAHRDPELAISAAVTVMGVMLRHVCLFPERLAMFPGVTLDRFRGELRSMLWSYLNIVGPD
jgi:hypothetical protein